MKVKPCHCCGGSGEEINHVKEGRNLRSKRLAHGIKASYVAAVLGISNSMLTYLEQGQRKWTRALIDKYKELVGE